MLSSWALVELFVLQSLGVAPFPAAQLLITDFKPEHIVPNIKDPFRPKGLYEMAATDILGIMIPN